MIYYAWKKDKTDRVFNALREKSETGVPIVVEGRRDEAALRRMGVKGPVLCLKAAGESRLGFLEKLDGYRHVVLFTDFDREGGELHAWLYHQLSNLGIRADDLLWRKVKSLARTEVRSVEELPGFARSLEAKAIGERA